MFRLKVNFRIDSLEIDSKYRRKFLSIIKEVFKVGSEDLYERYYADKKKNIMKPFVWSVYLPIAKDEKRKMEMEENKKDVKEDFKDEDLSIEEIYQRIKEYMAKKREVLSKGEKWKGSRKENPKINKFKLYSNQAFLVFSCYDYESLIAFYNGVLTLKRRKEKFCDNIWIDKVEPIPMRKIYSNEVIFKTLSPILVREIDKINDRKLGLKYMIYKEENKNKFEEAIFNNLRILFKEFRNIDIDKEDFKFDFKLNPVCAFTYENEIANRGSIRIKSKPEYLDFIYMVGLGAKRSQGYGMLEIAG